MTNIYSIRKVKETKLGTRFYIDSDSSCILADELGGKLLKDGRVSVVWGSKKSLIEKINEIDTISFTDTL